MADDQDHAGDDPLAVAVATAVAAGRLPPPSYYVDAAAWHHAASSANPSRRWFGSALLGWAEVKRCAMIEAGAVARRREDEDAAQRRQARQKGSAVAAGPHRKHRAELTDQVREEAHRLGIPLPVPRGMREELIRFLAGLGAKRSTAQSIIRDLD